MSGFYTIEQAAKRVGKTQRTIRNWIDGGLVLRGGYIREDELLERDRLMRSRRGRPQKADPVAVVLGDIAAERARQEAKWGEQNHPDGSGPDSQPLLAHTATGIADDDEASLIRDMLRGRTDWRFHDLDADRPGTWVDVLLEEVFEALAEDDPALLRAELIQVAAVAAAWVEAIDRRGASNG